MKSIVVLLVALATATAVTGFQYTEEWEAWKEKHGRVYESDEIEHHRHTIWEKKMKFIEEHNANADEKGFTLEMNKFGDLEAEEITELYTGYLPHNETDDDIDDLFSLDDDGPEDFNDFQLRVPTSVNWNRRGAVTAVKDQGRCRACYAFGATGALEGQYAIETNRLVSFSEQQIIDCSSRNGNRGCNGGRPAFAFEYLENVRGIQSERSYPYQNKFRAQRCDFRRRRAVTGVATYGTVRRGSESALKRSVAYIGPIAATIDASQPTFGQYSGGVYNEPRCSSRLNRLNHIVLIVGYGVERRQPYWLVKNSWGTNWGINGYIKMSRNRRNQCGIATKATYPRIKLL